MSHSSWSKPRMKQLSEMNYALVKTPVWECSDESCPCWMRQQLAFEEQPRCPICRAEMVAAIRSLPRVSDREAR